MRRPPASSSTRRWTSDVSRGWSSVARCGRERGEAPARVSAPAPECYFVPGVVVVVADPEPEALPDGVVVVLLLPDGVVVVVLPLPVLLLPGVVVPGEADGGVVRSGVLPTRSESVRLQAAV